MKNEKINKRLKVAADLERFESLREKLSSSLIAAGVTPKELLATLPAARKRVYEKHYSSKSSGGGDGRKRTRGKLRPTRNT